MPLTQEWRDRVAEMFRVIDGDHDDRVTYGELQMFLSPQGAQNLMDWCDADSDGRITMVEWTRWWDHRSPMHLDDSRMRADFVRLLEGFEAKIFVKGR